MFFYAVSNTVKQNQIEPRKNSSHQIYPLNNYLILRHWKHAYDFLTREVI